MPTSGQAPIRSPTSTAPISAACTVSVLAKVLPTAKLRKAKTRSSRKVAAICDAAPTSAQIRNGAVTAGSRRPPGPVSRARSSNPHGSANRKRA